MTTRSGSSSRSSVSTCSSCKRTSSSSTRYPARVASPSGGNREYLIGRQNGLLASVSAGKIILTFNWTPPTRLFRSDFDRLYGKKNHGDTGITGINQAER